MDVLCSSENGVGLNGEGHALTICVGGRRVEVEEVVVEWVVGGGEYPEDPTRVSA